MAWREIPRQKWRGFLRGFSSEHRDWQVTVEVRAGGSARVPYLLEPLRQIRIDGDRVVVTAGDDCDTEIEGPVRIRVDQTPEHADRALEIEGRDESLRLQFRVEIPAEMVDGATD